MKTVKDNLTNLLGEFEIDYVKLEHDKIYHVNATHRGETTTEIDKEVVMDYIPDSVLKDAEALMKLETITWNNVNNHVFLGDHRGRYDNGRGQWLNAVDLGMEAVSPYELTLVYGIISTINTLKSL